MAIDPRLVITDGTIEVDLLGRDSGWKLADPYWNPQIAQYKGGGTHVNAQLAEGQRLVHKNFDNVIETIPLSLRGYNQAKAMQTANEALALLRQAGDYWTESYEYNPVWIEVKFPCNACLTGYSRVVTGRIPELDNPFGQPSFSGYNESVMEGITIILEREPFWSIVQPGQMIGPLFNLIDNPDFELWSFGIADSTPDSWTDLETTHIIGQNSQEVTLPKFGQSALKIRVSGSTLAGAAKGLTQIISDTEPSTTYTVIAWVRSEGVSNGVGRVLINYSNQMELYRDSASHGWTLYTTTITTSTSASEVVSVSVEILTTAASTDGTIYVDGLMFIEGDWEQEAKDNVLPYISGSHIVNHWDRPDGLIEAGDINWVDAWNVPGNVNSLIRLELKNNTTPADTADIVEVFARVRIGMRRANDIFNYQAILDSPGASDTTASSDTRVNTTTLNTDWQTIVTDIISQNVLDNEGRFRLWARVYDTQAVEASALAVRAQYWIGAANIGVKTLDSVSVQALQNWTLVNLTPTRALNMDKKFAATQPNQLGYNIQMRRPTATDNAYFDYAIRMPTDGGYIEAIIDPPITPSNDLIIDNIISPDVGATFRQSGWQLETSAPTNAVHVDKYKGDVYVLTGTDIYRYSQGVWSVSLSGADGQNSDIEEYDGYLYHAAYSSPNTILNRTLDGVTWEEAFNQNLGITGSLESGLKAFNGYLYIGVTGGEILRWDGSTMTEVFEGTRIWGLEVFNNHLFASDNFTGDIYEYDPISDTWSVNTNLGISLYGLKATTNGYLYVGTGTIFPASNDGFIYRYDGETWVQVATFADTGVDRLLGLEEHNGRIYGIGGPIETSPGPGRVISSGDNGDTWRNELATSSDELENGLSANGLLYVVGQEGVFTLSTQAIQYKVTDFSGTPFLAPPRTKTNERRHRYFFSYDRENFINDLDDAALIGIGFVPRYLEPPMSEK